MENETTQEKSVVLAFRCPDCGSNQLMEVMSHGVEVQTPIVEAIYCADSGKAVLGYDEDEVQEDTLFDERYFACFGCKNPLEDEDGNRVTGEEGLAEWLMENCQQTTALEE